MPSELILASASPRRAQLLRNLGIPFEQVPSGVEEDRGRGDPADVAREAALQKARTVARARSEAVVIGADTVVVSPQGEIMGKPADEADALRMLMALADREHQVITGVALVGSGTEAASVETTRVRMRAFDREEAARYIRSGEPMDKAGAYGIQGLGGLLVESVTGCYFNVVGLPLRRLYEMLRSEARAADWLGPDADDSLNLSPEEPDD